MNYCSITDMIASYTEEALIQLTDDAGTGAYDADVLNAEITNGAEEMDPYLRPYYSASMPFTTVPGMLKMLNVDIAFYRTHKRRGRIPDVVSDAYKEAIRKLEKISEGKLKLGTTTGIVTEDEDEVSFTDKVPEDRIFRAPEGY